MTNILAAEHKLSEGSSGYSLETTFFVDVSAHASQEAALYDVLQRPDIPRRGDPHPAVPNIKLVDREATPNENDPKRIMVKLRYGVPQPGDPVSGVTTVRTGSGSHGDQVNVDLRGRPIRTEMQVATALPDGSSTTRLDQQVHNVDVERPATTTEFERVEVENPTPKSRQYVGRVNSTRWYGGAAGTWLCVGIEGDSDDGGQTYKVSYSFQYNPDGWNPVVRHRDPQTGLPAFFNVFERSVITAEVYRSANFGALRLLQGLRT